MARPRLGAAARTTSASVKISERETAVLTARYGSVHKGLRAALDSLLGVRTSHEPAEKAVHTQPAMTDPCRIHRAFTDVRRFHDKGQEFVERVCMDCGTRVTSEVHR